MSTAKLEDSTQRPLYGERIIEESVFEAITFQLRFLVEGIYLNCYR